MFREIEKIDSLGIDQFFQRFDLLLCSFGKRKIQSWWDETIMNMTWLKNFSAMIVHFPNVNFITQGLL